MNPIDDLTLAVTPVKKVFEAMRIPYFVGGSVASSYHGATRSTIDINLVDDLKLAHVNQFTKLINADYYISEPAVEEAIKRKAVLSLYTPRPRSK